MDEKLSWKYSDVTLTVTLVKISLKLQSWTFRSATVISCLKSLGALYILWTTRATINAGSRDRYSINGRGLWWWRPLWPLGNYGYHALNILKKYVPCEYENQRYKSASNKKIFIHERIREKVKPTPRIGCPPMSAFMCVNHRLVNSLFSLKSEETSMSRITGALKGKTIGYPWIPLT